MFFSVRKCLKIGGKVYLPCICYELPLSLVPTVEKLVKEEKAYIYDEYVGFMNGKKLVKAKKKVVTKKEKKDKKVFTETDTLDF